MDPVLAPFIASIHPPPARASFIKQYTGVETPLRNREYTPSAVAPVAAFKVEALRTVELEPERVSTGAELSALTTTFTETAVADARVPSHALTVNAARVPLALAAGVQTRLSPGPSNVLPTVTPTPFFLRVPPVTPSTRKEIVAPSTSASFAAAASAS